MSVQTCAARHWSRRSLWKTTTHIHYHGQLRSLASTSRSAPLGTAAGLFKSIGLRREDKNRWERRVALTPQHVERLVKDLGATVYVQPSTNRTFRDWRYEKAGAIITEDLSQADVIFGIKEVPIEKLIPNKTYVIFSHTHKAQPYNMPTLQAFLDKNLRIIDYELLTDDTGKRTVLFGRYAGLVGMIDGLHGLGLKLLGMGYDSPFMHIGMSHTYRSLASARLTLQELGNEIVDGGLPEFFHPMTFVFTGTGNVSQGAQEIFKQLPHEFVDPSELEKLVKSKGVNRKKVYGCVVQSKDHLIGKDGAPFDHAQYRANPQSYTSNFYENYAPYTSMLVNGVYWDTGFPRLLTNEQLRAIQQSPDCNNRMISVADISCDVNGSIEFMSHMTDIEAPFYYVDAVKGIDHHDVEAPGVQVLAVENLPTEMPIDASEHFSQSLFPLAKELIKGNSELPVFERATICENGQLRDRHKHLMKHLPGGAISSTNTNDSTTAAHLKKNKRILVLGSGFVAGPLVDYLARSKDFQLIIGSNSLTDAKALASNHDNVSAITVDVGNRDQLSTLIQDVDIVVSLVPAFMHGEIAKLCIGHRKHMVTASYVSPEMRQLDQKAQEADVVILNEIGLDPGIDHMSAMKMIDEIKAEGGKIRGFTSWCGGLPSPELSSVPLSYKFSWSPRGVLLAALNEAKYKLNGQMTTIPGAQLLKERFSQVDIMPGFALEGLANRNSLGYADMYGLGSVDQLDTMFRGTLRYQGYSQLLGMFSQLGLLSTQFASSTVPQQFNSWIEFFDTVLTSNDKPTTLSNDARRALIQERVSPNDTTSINNLWAALDYLHLLPASTSSSNSSGSGNRPQFRLSAASPIDGFSNILAERLAYTPGERDLVLLHHALDVEHANGQREKFTSTLASYGTFGQVTAMAKTVGLPAAMGTELILRGGISTRGVITPTLKEIYRPLLSQLEYEGIRMIESRTPLSTSS
ncbi:Saccharopine dehydrogenase-domain-containing protein [Syncephalis plumigaleata]|nr:Saccharopine dehydrogenase-domain-containing protein [Syncephalis plumigaleata]